MAGSEKLWLAGKDWKDFQSCFNLVKKKIDAKKLLLVYVHTTKVAVVRESHKLFFESEGKI
jgi:hypothetical protein